MTAGTCGVMGTASTMACVAEALGFVLPGTASDAGGACRSAAGGGSTGMAAVRLVGSRRTPERIVDARSVENALRVLLALGGSTNAVIHLTAIAGRAGVKVSPGQLNRLSDTTPVLVNLKPVGNGYMEDFFACGGMGALLRELAPLLHLDCPTVTGETLGERLASMPRSMSTAPSSPRARRRSSRRAASSPCSATSLRKARSSSARRPSAPVRARGPRGGVHSLADLAARIDDPALDVAPHDMLVLQNAGPHAPECMPEAGYLPIPRKLARSGVKDMIRISDARMSGTAFGTIVLHVTPDAASGGPLALVRSGDRIRLSVENRRIDLLVEDAELRRRAGARTPAREVPARGYARLYAQEILGADAGCDFAFLRPPAVGG